MKPKKQKPTEDLSSRRITVSEDEVFLVRDGKELPGSAMPRVILNARGLLIGRRIVDLGYINYVDPFSGERYQPCLVLDDGTKILAQMDDENNGPGVLALENKDGYGELLCQVN